MTDLEKILEKVARMETPTPADIEAVLKLTERLRANVEEEVKKQRVEAESRVEGSIAKDTWLRSDKDADIFLLFPPDLEKEDLAALGLQVAKNRVREYGWVERYAEHPYLETRIGDLRVNIVPCYKVEAGQWRSATDRTPYHTDYIKARLRSSEQKKSVRLLKRFMKGIGVYGADIKTGGFSGYLTELLILHFGDFTTTLKAVSGWREGELIDLEGHYAGRVEDVRKLFEDPLIVIDPVDRRRNVASAVRRECFDRFRVASKYLLKDPDLTFFYPPPPRPLTSDRLLRRLTDGGSDLLFVILENIEAVPDILWGQLYKTLRALGGLLKQHDFKLMRSAVWSDEQRYSILIFELESSCLGRLKKHLGPPVLTWEEEKFLEKYTASGVTVAGPWVEMGRWVALIERKFPEATALLAHGLADGGEVIGVPSRVSKAVKRGVEILKNSEIAGFYGRGTEFNGFLTRFLEGRPEWLERPNTTEGSSN